MSSPILQQETVPSATLATVDGRLYPLESAHLSARAEGGFALSTLAQSFVNPYDEPLEVLYTMPLPADGAVLGYTITIGETVIRGEVQPRESAERAYREALYEGRTAGLLEQARVATFQQRLGNVPPRTRVAVAIDVLHRLAFVAMGTGAERGGDARWEYRFPTVVGVRYHGAPGRVGDAAALSPARDLDGGIPARVSFELAIADATGDDASASHAIDARRDGGVLRVASREGERLDRDVTVRWSACSSAIGVRVVEGSGLPGDDGRYALVTLTPPAGPVVAAPRDLTLLIDASGSMSGMPLEAAVRIAGEVLRSLGGRDRFELLAFSNDVRPLTRGTVPWSKSALASALGQLAALRAEGGTEMAHAIKAAVAPLRGEAQRQVVLITDGEISFEREVVERVTQSANVRLHVVGVGYAPNRALTRMAAVAGRGLEVLAGSLADVDEAARRLVAGTASPVIVGIEVAGTAIAGPAPSELRDVFAGQPLAFSVELSPAGGTLELRGQRAGSREPWSERIAITPAGEAKALTRSPLPIGALYGRERIEAIETGIDHHLGPTALRQQRVEQLALRHRIASAMTSLVAIAELPSAGPSQPRRRERLAVELPHGVSAEGVGLFEAQTQRFVSFKRVGRPGPGLSLDEMGSDFAMSMLMDSAPRLKMWIGAAPEALPAGSAPAPKRDALVARWLGDRRLELVIEPGDEGFDVPEDEVEVTDVSRPGEAARVVRIESREELEGTLFGHGARIRLVLRVDDVAWKGGAELALVLPGLRGGLRFDVPPRTGA